MGNCSQQANSENTDIKEASSKRTTDNSPSSATANSNNNDDNNDKSDKMKSSLPQPNPPPYSKGGDKNASKDLSPPKPPVGGEERKGRQETLDKAASRIQRQIRKTHSVRAAKAAQQWKLFADLDTQDEAEMLHLAVFMQTLIDTVPGVTKTDQDTYIGTSSDARALFRINNIENHITAFILETRLCAVHTTLPHSPTHRGGQKRKPKEGAQR
eukprot:scaffold4020_cov276-Ochromonas_danica.AAC.1